MPLPKPSRAAEYARKGAELALRRIAQAPEQRRARALGANGQASLSTGGSPRVLVLSPRDWACHVQYEAVVAQALRVRGAHVEFLTCGGGLEVCDRSNVYEAPPMPCGSCQHYVRESLRAHGLEQGTIRTGWEPADRGSWPELDNIPADELLSVEVDGLKLGQAIDAPLKWFLCAGMLENDPAAPHFARAFLRSGRRIAQGVDAALDRTRPDIVLMLNGLFLFEAITRAICQQRGIEVITYERAFRKETLVFSREAPAGYYDFSAVWPEANRPLDDDEERELDEYLARRQDAQAFDQLWRFETRPVDKARPLVTLFTNISWDTAIISRNRAFPDIRTWINVTVENFARRTDCDLIIRVHPAELALPGKRTRDPLCDHVARRFPELPPNIKVIGPGDMTSSYPLMRQSVLGLVYTSTTGLEMALAGTPVIVSGETHYRDKGFTIDVDDHESFASAIDNVLAEPARFRPDTERARRYAHLFFFRAPISFRAVTEPLPGLARLTVRSTDELAPGADSELDRICDGILRGDRFVKG